MKFINLDNLRHYHSLIKGMLEVGGNVELSDAAVAYSDFSKSGSSLKLVYNENNELELKLGRPYNVTLITPAYIWYGSTGPMTFTVKSNDFTEGEGDITIDLSTGDGCTFDSLSSSTEASTSVPLSTIAKTDITVSWSIGTTKQKDKTIQCRLPILYESSEISDSDRFYDDSLNTTAGYKYDGTFTFNDLTPTVDEIYIGIPGSNDMGDVHYFEYMSGTALCDCKTITQPEATIYINGQALVYTIFKCRVTSGFNFRITNIY